MASISSAGIGSGLDINGIISKLMDVEKQPLTLLDKKEASYQAKLSAFGSLKAAASTLETKAFALKSASVYSARSVSSSDTTSLTASANTAATPGSYALQVIDLAQAHTLSSQTFSSLTSDLSTYTGKLKIELGSLSGTTFTADPARAAVTINIAAGQSSLNDIRDAINGANAGVKASIVNVADGQYKLTLTSSESGAKQSIRLTTLNASDVVVNNNADLARFSFNPAGAAGGGKEFEVTAAAQNSRFKVDGVEISRSTNTVSDAITGVTLNLLKAGSTSTIKVTANPEAAATAINAFVTAYNDLNTQLRDLTAYDSGTKQAALLLGDAGARGLQSSLRHLINNEFSGTGSVKRLSDLGVSMQRDGSLLFNSSAFTSALDKNPTTVINALTSTVESKPGLAVSLASRLKSLISDGGLIEGKTDSIESSIKDLTRQRERLGLRLGQIEARYRKQFTSLDSLVASMQQTSAYLQRQLAGLAGGSQQS